jgi:hypothetical protein
MSTDTKDKMLRPYVIAAAVVIACALCAGGLYIAMDERVVATNEPVTRVNISGKSGSEAKIIPDAEAPATGSLDAPQSSAADVAETIEEPDSGVPDAEAAPVGGSTGGSGSSAGGSDPNKGKIWHEGWNEWVVDSAGHYEQQLVSDAWDEATGHYGDICNDCGVEVTGSWGSHVIATGHTGYSNYHWFSSGFIHHAAVYQDIWVDETGHNVWHEGYWE